MECWKLIERLVKETCKTSRIGPVKEEQLGFASRSTIISHQSLCYHFRKIQLLISFLHFLSNVKLVLDNELELISSFSSC